MTVPVHPKIFHIVHEDKLPSIIQSDELICDAVIAKNPKPGTTIGMNSIKTRRKTMPLSSHPGLHVAECVPFYFCPRSVMLFLIHKASQPGLTYTGGQNPIVHLKFDLQQVVAWANANKRRWAFTLSNASSYYFEDHCDLAKLNEVDWASVKARQWSGPGIPDKMKERKQAEFLVESSLPWYLVECIGVRIRATYQQVAHILADSAHKPIVKIKPEWYY